MLTRACFCVDMTKIVNTFFLGESQILAPASRIADTCIFQCLRQKCQKVFFAHVSTNIYTCKHKC